MCIGIWCSVWELDPVVLVLHPEDINLVVFREMVKQIVFLPGNTKTSPCKGGGAHFANHYAEHSIMLHHVHELTFDKHFSMDVLPSCKLNCHGESYGSVRLVSLCRHSTQGEANTESCGCKAICVSTCRRLFVNIVSVLTQTVGAFFVHISAENENNT